MGSIQVDRLSSLTKTKLGVGDAINVEIAGTAIGDAIISEITDDYVEVVYFGKTFKLPPNALDYFDLFHMYA